VRAAKTPNEGTGPVRWISHARVKGRDEPCVHSIEEARFCRRGSKSTTSLEAAIDVLWDQLGCACRLPRPSACPSSAYRLSIAHGGVAMSSPSSVSPHCTKGYSRHARSKQAGCADSKPACYGRPKLPRAAFVLAAGRPRQPPANHGGAG